MLTRLGKTAAPDDAAGLLLDCHDRIRGFLALAARIAQAGADDLESVPEAALRVHRYFTQALPLHARDEEESVLPRLRGRDPAVDAELLAMAREHAEHEAPVAALTGACDEIARDPTRAPALLRGVGRAAAELERHFAAHLRREESVIFPALRRLLDPAADAEIVREIRARRGAGSIPTASPTR
jgi:iron-sulfur cluster repair protein YtfE (RIC family)